jgi:hypothetical protein
MYEGWLSLSFKHTRCLCMLSHGAWIPVNERSTTSPDEKAREIYVGRSSTPKDHCAEKAAVWCSRVPMLKWSRAPFFVKHVLVRREASHPPALVAMTAPECLELVLCSVKKSVAAFEKSRTIPPTPLTDNLLCRPCSTVACGVSSACIWLLSQLIVLSWIKDSFSVYSTTLGNRCSPTQRWRFHWL